MGKTKQLSVLRGDPFLISLRDRRECVNTTGKHRKRLESSVPSCLCCTQTLSAESGYMGSVPSAKTYMKGLSSGSLKLATQAPRTCQVLLVSLFRFSPLNLPLRDGNQCQRVAFQYCWKNNVKIRKNKKEIITFSLTVFDKLWPLGIMNYISNPLGFCCSSNLIKLTHTKKRHRNGMRGLCVHLVLGTWE